MKATAYITNLFRIPEISTLPFSSIEYKTDIQERVKDIEEENINIRKQSKKEQQDLNNLREIEEYLPRVLDEHQKILNSHFDLKILYSEE